MPNPPLKLAFSTLGCPGWSLRQAVNACRDMGYDAIEVRGIGSELRSERIADFLPHNQQATRAMLREAGVALCALGTSAMFHDAANVPAAMEEARAAIGVCAAMGIPAIRVFGDRLPPGEDAHAVVVRVANALGELCQYARPLGVHVLLEVHGDFNRIQPLSELIALAGTNRGFGLIWDVEHSHRAYGKDFLPFYRAIAPFVRHVHFKDCRMLSEQALCVLPGQGEVPLAAILAALREDGYRGYLSFEWEKRWIAGLAEPEIALPLFVRHVRALEHG